MHQKECGLEGINAKILNNLKNNQALWRRYSLDPIARDVTKFFPKPKPNLAVSIIGKVLQKHGKDVFAEYMRRLAKIEIGVQKFNPRLRDHVNHSVYTFFLGLYFESNLKKIRIGSPLSWKLAAFLHDIGYPIELFSSSTREYLDKVHSLRTDIIQKNRHKIKAPTYSLYIRDFENLISGNNAFELINSRLSDWGISVDLKQVYEGKMKKGMVDHGILSSLMVLNIIDALYVRYNPDGLEAPVVRENLDWSMSYFKHDILDAVSAIAAHNLTLDDLKSPVISEKTPTLYFLSLCDSLQVWNRFSPELQVYSPNSIDFKFEKNRVSCSLALSDKDFQRTQDDVSRLQSGRINLQITQARAQ